MSAAAAKAISLYLPAAIGFKGGASVASHGINAKLLATVAAGLVLSVGLPFVAFALLRLMTRLSRIDAAAVAAHHGSISIVTFVAAAMAAPAILSALWLVARGGTAREPGLWREILLKGAIILLIGAFAIGMITGEKGLADISGVIVEPFKRVLCRFLLDMGLVAGRGLREQRGGLGIGAIAFGILMPLVGNMAGLALGLLIGLSTAAGWRCCGSGRFGQLHRCACRDAGRPAAGQPLDLSDAVAGGDVSVQPEPRHPALYCRRRSCDRSLIRCKPIPPNASRLSSRPRWNAA